MNIILTTLVLAAEPALEQETKPVTEIIADQKTESRLGKEAISKIRSDYLAGKYATTFKQLDVAYEESSKEDGLKNLAEMRIGPMQDQAAWEAVMMKTLTERNAELKKVVDGKEGNISLKVLSAITTHDPKVDEALSALGRLHTLAPGQGNNEDENQIINIDFEYEYKTLYLDMPVMTGQKEEAAREKQIALKMEQLDRMLAISKDFQDESLKSAIETVHSHLDELLAQNWDMTDLHALTRNAQTPTEENISKVLTNYREKFSELSKTFLEKQVVENRAQVE